MSPKGFRPRAKSDRLGIAARALIRLCAVATSTPTEKKEGVFDGVSKADELLAEMGPEERAAAELLDRLLDTLSPEAQRSLVSQLGQFCDHLEHCETLAALSPILPGYQPPISTEARYSRSRGKHGRRRGEDDPAPLNAKRPGGNRSVAHRTVGEGDRRSLAPRRIPRPPPPNQPPIRRAAFRLPWCSRAPAIQTRGDAAS